MKNGKRIIYYNQALYTENTTHIYWNGHCERKKKRSNDSFENRENSFQFSFGI